MVTDTTSDFLTRIRNASLIKSQRVIVPKTNGNVALTKILEQEGYISGFEMEGDNLTLQLKYKGRDQKPLITNLKRVSKPGRRIYSASKDVPRILGGMGILIVSTSVGLMTDRQARAQKLGGELVCSIW
jgi:small subunit ribosomal protein S8